MNRAIKVLSVVVPLCAVGALFSADAKAQVVVYGAPPPAVVASYDPVYYNGYAHYYYGNRWYYRDHGGAWRYYDHHPYLDGYRGRWEGYHHRWR
jgi:hypothetical protein